MDLITNSNPTVSINNTTYSVSSNGEIVIPISPSGTYTITKGTTNTYNYTGRIKIAMRIIIKKIFLIVFLFVFSYYSFKVLNKLSFDYVVKGIYDNIFKIIKYILFYLYIFIAVINMQTFKKNGNNFSLKRINYKQVVKKLLYNIFLIWVFYYIFGFIFIVALGPFPD